ncbi:hypothetical protein GOP47_0001104 [Adiantum capillus-veneris]|uniref:Uncharacterized protein n=1 Tax=Adiantum capillus-veneris TaxID=13818 RepID=A0A9D4ZRC7_ADICA|nr:hypothetical protein GOP47_0001092 [Adiantum capillus-veneris]KAI5084924.1 hypothetical protein GOP47_0001093 [Adiantum capillus-veneris]KAI5084935.1 hypothetical protein GOP47_0001104 [Adiantum capillus-veneris]
MDPFMDFKAGYTVEEAFRFVQTPEMVDSMKKLDISIPKPGFKEQTPAKLDKIFTLSKKRKIGTEGMNLAKQLDFEDSSAKGNQGRVAIEYAGMAIKMLTEV